MISEGLKGIFKRHSTVVFSCLELFACVSCGWGWLQINMMWEIINEK